MKFKYEWREAARQVDFLLEDFDGDCGIDYLDAHFVEGYVYARLNLYKMGKRSNKHFQDGVGILLHECEVPGDKTIFEEICKELEELLTW